MRKKYYLFLLLLCLQGTAHAQKEWSNWIGGSLGLTFRNGVPQIFTTSSSSSGGIGFPFVNEYHYNGARAVAYSDSLTGQVKFVATNRAVYSRNYDTVKNGYGLIGCDDSRYSVQIIPFPDGQNKFYILYNFPAYTVTGFSGLQTRCSVYGYATGSSPGMRYSILDLDANNGLGEITSKNNWLPVGGDKLAMVRHSNKKDVWVIGHGANSAHFGIVLIATNGIQAAWSQNPGFQFTSSGTDWIHGGIIDASPDGNRIAVTSGSNKKVNIYSFNNTTGTLTFTTAVTLPGNAHQVCFSPDGSKLYIGSSVSKGCNYTNKLFQVDLQQAVVQESLYQLYDDPTGNSSFEMQRVPGNKIYMPGRSVYDPNLPTRPMYYAIEHPNQPKGAAVLNDKAYLGANFVSIPNVINDHIRQAAEVPAVDMNLAKDTSVCLGNYTISAQGGYAEYRWSTGATTQSITVSKPGLYSVQAGAAGFTQASAYGFTNVTAKTQAYDLGKDTLLCPKDNYTISLPSSFTNILWQDGDTSANHTVLNKNGGGRQTFTALDGNGCRVSDSVCVWFKYNPRANFGNDTTLCTGENLLLRMEPMQIFSFGAVYQWQDGSNKDTFRVTAPGKYWGRATYDGCTVSDTINVNFVNISGPALNIGPDSSLCDGEFLTLTANVNNGSYLWNTGETTQSIVVYYSDHYWVKVNYGGCTAIDTADIKFWYPPLLELGADTTVCEGTNHTLNAYNYSHTSNTRYRWQDGSTNSYFHVTAPGTYYVDVFRANCKVTDTLRVKFKQKPNVYLGKDTLLCDGATMQLNAYDPSFSSYLWQDGSKASTYTVRGYGTYYVQVQGSNGCYGRDTIFVNTRFMPYFSLGPDKTVCAGEPVNYSLNIPNATFLWSNLSTTGSASITQPGIHWVQVDHNGCRKRDSVVITHKPLPVVDLGPDTTLCTGSAKLLNAANPAATYQWQDGSTGSTYTVTAPGSYSVRVTMNGCVSTDAVYIDYKTAPFFNLGKDTVICEDNTIALAGPTSQGTFTWQDGSQAQTYTVRAPGTYSLTVTNDCGSTSDAIVISKGLCDLLMPNAFTPNGDGLNDVFRVKFPQFIRTFDMIIYNRRGETVYHTRNAGEGWDGTTANRPQPAANYIWRITYTDVKGATVTKWGNIVLIR
jgi:gliding motility-associated-like protein